MLEIEKYIKKHVGRKILFTLTFSPSPNGGGQDGPRDRVPATEQEHVSERL